MRERSENGRGKLRGGKGRGAVRRGKGRAGVSLMANH